MLIQSFEVGNLRYLRGRLGAGNPNVGLMQLLGAADRQPYDAVAAQRATTYGAMSSGPGLREIASYADAIGVHTRSLGPGSTLVEAAHAVGLKVFAYTFRPENQFLGEAFKDGDVPAARNEDGSIREMRAYIAAGIDGFFTDDPALGRRAVDAGR